jgi:hypothetical protein
MWILHRCAGQTRENILESISGKLVELVTCHDYIRQKVRRISRRTMTLPPAKIVLRCKLQD